MDRQRLFFHAGILLFLTSVLLIGSTGSAGEYVALNSVKEIKVVFDVRGKNVKPIALQLDLIHKTYHDANIRGITNKPEVAVVFGGGAVKLISKTRDGYTEDEKRLLGIIQDKLAEMNRDGIRLEVCLFAANVHGVDPPTIPEFINRVDNGWISILGYQQKGYSLVAVF